MIGPIWNAAAHARRFWDAFRKTSLLQWLDPCHPLLRLLQTEAPGTYFHSLIVGSLAEAAALRIGADARLVRVGALYHDVGKLRRPALFGENGLSGAYEDLDPVTNTQWIIQHVADGVAMAQAYGLPQPVQDLIAQHHGTSLVGHFYQKAVAMGQATSEGLFRYPGPRPQTAEAGVLMLADIVEAGVRAWQPRGRAEVAATVARLVEARWAEGELVESGLGRSDLRPICAAFEETLHGVYHARTPHPIAPLPRPTATPPRAARRTVGALSQPS